MALSRVFAGNLIARRCYIGCARIVYPSSWTIRSLSNGFLFRTSRIPFLLVGSLAQLAGIVILQLLMNTGSPLYLDHEFFVDGEPFWRRRVYWAQFIQILLVMPVNFVVNKVWTFRAVRGPKPVDEVVDSLRGRGRR